MATTLDILVTAMALVEKDKERNSANAGLCFYLEKAKEKMWLCGFLNDNTFNQNKHTILRLMTEWPGFSGMVYYPVPGCGHHNAAQAYERLKRVMWDENHPYGQNRLEMVAWIKQQLENGVDN